MTVLVECPSCEEEILVDGAPEAEYECPHCRCRFQYAGEMDENSAGPSNPRAVEPSLPLPRKVANLRNRTEREPASALSEQLDSAPIATPPQPADIIEVSPIFGSRRAGQGARGIWILGGSVAVVLFAAAIIAGINGFSPKRTVHSADVKPEQTLQATRVSPSTEIGGSKNDAGEAGGDLKANAVSDWQNLRLGSREEYYSLWATVHPHLVCLDVQTTTETRSIGGVIVDSRGYVATSYGAIRDAIAIEVQAAPKSLASGQPVGELKDQVRGLVAKDEAHDLAILEINRRFVSSFASLKFGDSSAALPGTRCVAAVPPGDNGRMWLMDFPIRQVQPFSRLLPEFQAAVEAQQLDTSDGTSWIIGAVSAGRAQAGSPVFNFDGELVTVLTRASSQSQVAACPGQRVVDLLKDASKTATPFPIDPLVAADLAANDEVMRRMPDTSSPAFALAQRLQQNAQRVARFNSLPRSPEQYGVLREFADAVRNVDEQTQSGEWTETQAGEAQKFLRDVLDRFTANLKKSAGSQPSDLAEINQWACEGSAKGQSFGAFGEVVRTGLRPPDNTPFVIFRLIGSDQNVFSTIEHDGPIFLPGSQWFVLGRWLPKMTYRSNDGNSTIDARVGEIDYVISLSPTESK